MQQSNALGPLLRRSARLVRERLEVRLNVYDVTPEQAYTLMYLYRRGGQVPQGEVIEFLKVRPSTANGILDRLEEKHLIIRTISGTDARRRHITLTDQGVERQTQFRESFRSAEETVTRGLSPQETALLRGLLGRVIENLEEDRSL